MSSDGAEPRLKSHLGHFNHGAPSGRKRSAELKRREAVQPSRFCPRRFNSWLNTTGESQWGGRKGRNSSELAAFAWRGSAARAEQHGWTPGDHACSHGGGAPIAALRLRSLLPISAAETTMSRKRERLSGLCPTLASPESPARRGRARATRRLTSFLSGSSL